MVAINSTEEMHIKAKMRYHHTTTRMAIIKKTNNIKSVSDVEKLSPHPQTAG